MTNPSLSSDPIADLWREARAWLAAALRDFRGPAEIARTLAHEARAAIRARLLLIESLLMKLLLIEASRFHAEPSQLRSDGPPASSRHVFQTTETATPTRTEIAAWKPPVRRSEDPARPETWRVRFHLRMPPECARPRGISPRNLTARPGAEAAQRRAAAHAAALGRRFEALRRVLADPRAAIARLARRLRRLGSFALAVAHRIALARPPRTQRLGPVLANAIVHGCDASAGLRIDSS